MFPKNSIIKQAARESLNGSWGQIMLAGLLTAACVALPILLRDVAVDILRSGARFVLVRDIDAAATVFTAVYFFLIACPLMFGLLRMFWIITAGQRPTLYTLFSFFGDRAVYRRALKVQLAFIWRAALAALICMFPYLLLRLAAVTGADKALGIASWVTNFGAVGDAYSLGMTALSVVTFFLAVSFMPLPFVMINRPELPVRDLIVDTKRISKRFRGKYIFFLFSFIGWYFLSVFILPLFFTLPFFFASWAVLARFSIYHASKA